MNSPDMHPFMYQDLISSNTGMLPTFGMPLMTGMYPTNLLGGTQLPSQPDGDKFVAMKQKDKQERNAFLISLAALAAIGTSTAMLFKGKINFKGIGNAVAAPFKSAGRGTQKAACGTISFVGKAGKQISKGFKSLGHLITAPFKYLGLGLKKLGKLIAAPFKGVKNLFKKTKKNNNPPSEIKGFLEAPKQSAANASANTSAGKSHEVLYPDKIIMPEKKTKERPKKKGPEIINIS